VVHGLRELARATVSELSFISPSLVLNCPYLRCTLTA
jgi:hypothetical protein